MYLTDAIHRNMDEASQFIMQWILHTIKLDSTKRLMAWPNWPLGKVVKLEPRFNEAVRNVNRLKKRILCDFPSPGTVIFKRFIIKFRE